MELYALRYGTSPFARALAFSDTAVVPGEAQITISWSLYLARHAGQVIVIDTGFTDRAVAAAWGITMHHDPADLLAGLGVGADQVDHVIITHHHNDHIADLARYTRARVHIAAAAREVYLREMGTRPDQGVGQILQDTQRTQASTQDHALIGGALVLEEIGGHSPGSSVVHLTGQNQRFLITGDECYLCANMQEGRPVGVTCDHGKNAAFIARERAAGAIPLPFHDPLIFEQYPRVGPDIVRIV